MNGGGDSLARGAKSFTFGPAKVTQEKWDKIWKEDAEPAQDPYDIGGVFEFGNEESLKKAK